MPKGFLKGNTLGQAPAPEGSPKRKLAAPQKPFNAEQQLYVNSLLEFREINHWFPYESLPREIRPRAHRYDRQGDEYQPQPPPTNH